MLIAGGGSRRAGLDKRFLVLEGRTLLVRNLAFLRGLFPEVAVVIGRGQSLDLGDEAGVRLLRDAWPGSSPLVGIATALRHFGRPVFVLAADIAFPQREAARAVIAAFRDHDVAMPAGANDFRQPLFAAYGPRCLPPMAKLLDVGSPPHRRHLPQRLRGRGTRLRRGPLPQHQHDGRLRERPARERPARARGRAPRPRRHRRQERLGQDHADREAGARAGAAGAARRHRQARRALVRDRPPRQGLLAPRTRRRRGLRDRLARAPRLHHPPRRRAAAHRDRGAASTAVSTSSSPRATSAPPRTGSSSSAAAPATPSRSAPPARRSPWSPTPRFRTRTASGSRTPPGWRASSPCAWTRCGRTDGRRRHGTNRLTTPPAGWTMPVMRSS